MWDALLIAFKSIGSSPYLGIVLTSLKLLGLFVSFVAGYIAALPEPKRNKIPKLRARSWVVRAVRTLMSKEWTLRWAVIGLAVAVVSQSLESWKAAIDDKENQTKNAAQLRTAQESLDYLERIATRFDTLSCSVTYELDPECIDFAPLYEFANHLMSESSSIEKNVNRVRQNAITQPSAGSNFLSSGLNAMSGTAPHTTSKVKYSEIAIGYINVAVNSNTFEHFEFNMSENPSRPGVSLTNVAGLIKFPVNTNTFEEFHFNMSEDPKRIEFTIPQSNGLHFLVALYSTNAMSDKACEFIYRRNFVLELSAVGSRNPDLKVAVTNLNTKPTVTCDRETKRLFIHWAFDCPKTNWEQTKWMTSLPDLAHARLGIFPFNEITNGMWPVNGELIFDRTTIPFKFTYAFHTNTIKGFKVHFGICILPGKLQILGLDSVEATHTNTQILNAIQQLKQKNMKRN